MSFLLGNFLWNATTCKHLLDIWMVISHPLYPGSSLPWRALCARDYFVTHHAFFPVSFFQPISNKGNEKRVIPFGVAHVQPIVVGHLIAKRDASSDLFTEQGFKNLFTRYVLHLRQNRFPVLKETAQVIIMKLNLEQVLEV